jgi:sucrose-6-phosphate hydrolase SacC (GH32 family)
MKNLTHPSRRTTSPHPRPRRMEPAVHERLQHALGTCRLPTPRLPGAEPPAHTHPIPCPRFLQAQGHITLITDPSACARRLAIQGHAVSADMVRWLELPAALTPDVGNECGGVWSGSATPAARVGAYANVSAHTGPVLSYSVQCNSFFGQAEPTDGEADALLVNWTKPSYNPTTGKPAHTAGFRDPSEAWLGSDGLWRQVAACTGGACLFTSDSFTKWNAAGWAVWGDYGPAPAPPSASPPSASDQLNITADRAGPSTSTTTRTSGRVLAAHRVERSSGARYSAATAASDPPDGPPTWECPDLFILPQRSRAFASSSNATMGQTEQSRTSAATPLWVFKASGALTPASASRGVDFWSTGTFDEASGKFTTGGGNLPVPSDAQRIDYGHFYASKTFLDPLSGERLIYGWVAEESGQPLLEWASMQSLPRTIREDPLQPGRLVFPPAGAIDSLRILPPAVIGRKRIDAQASVALPTNVGGGDGTQLDLTLRLLPPLVPQTCVSINVLGGAANASITILGGGSEGAQPTANALTTARLSIGPHSAVFNASNASSTPLELRVFVDGSIVEAFAAGGRAVATHRVYPMSEGGATHGGAAAVRNCGESTLMVDQVMVYAMAAATPPTRDALRTRASAAAAAAAAAASSV